MKLNWKELAALLAAVAVIYLLWETPVVYPLKILVVFFHELSHGLAAVLTGGSIVRVELVPEQGGLCVTQGGSRFLTLSAGYLGSMVWGAVLFVVASKTDADKGLTGFVGILLLTVGLLYVRPFLGFGFVFCLITGAAILAVAAYASRVVCDWLMRIVGLTSCLYVIPDIYSDTISRAELRSDARMLAEITGIPTQAWGALWIIAGLVVATLLLRMVLKGESTNDPTREAGASAD